MGRRRELERGLVARQGGVEVLRLGGLVARRRLGGAVAVRVAGVAGGGGGGGGAPCAWAPVLTVAAMVSREERGYEMAAQRLSTQD